MRGRLVLLCAFVCALACAAAGVWAAGAASRGARLARRAAQGEGRLDIRLRSFVPGASGVLTVEPSPEGGRFRLTALGLPAPQTQSRAARAYVVWASGEGGVLRLGELQRDSTGNGGLAFERPAGFEHFSVIVTAEPDADAGRLTGAPVLSTRANEAQALYPQPTPAAAETGVAGPAPPTTPAPPAPATGVRARPRRASPDFYAEVDDALAARGGGRVIELEGERETASARADARATVHGESAYVRANFRGVPLPSAVGASVYVLWAIVSDGRIVYMGSLPSTQDLNRAEIYVRVREFGPDDFNLFVTAERQRPAAYPSDRRVLTPRDAKLIVK